MDKIVRRMAFDKHLAQEEKALTPEARRYLQSYADGVNAYLASHARPWPFFLVGYKPTDWKVIFNMLLVSYRIYFFFVQNSSYKLLFFCSLPPGY